MNEKQQQQLQPSDHDIVVEDHAILKRLEKWTENHMEHHFRYTIMAWTATIGLVAALILALVKG